MLDIIKKGHRLLRQRTRLGYAFNHDHANQYPVRRLCRVMAMHPSDSRSHYLGLHYLRDVLPSCLNVKMIDKESVGDFGTTERSRTRKERPSNDILASPMEANH